MTRSGYPKAFEQFCKAQGFGITSYDAYQRAKIEGAWAAWRHRAANPSSQASSADYEEVLTDHRRLVRELDVLLNGEAGAAKQASLCDIVKQVETQGIKVAAQRAGRKPQYDWGQDGEGYFIIIGPNFPDTCFFRGRKQAEELVEFLNKLCDPIETNNASVAVIQFVLSLDDDSTIDFLRYWNEGEFDHCRREWPEAPDECYIGADQFFVPKVKS